jgi:hypothetical protein
LLRHLRDNHAATIVALPADHFSDRPLPVASDRSAV